MNFSEINVSMKASTAEALCPPTGTHSPAGLHNGGLGKKKTDRLSQDWPTGKFPKLPDGQSASVENPRTLINNH